MENRGMEELTTEIASLNENTALEITRRLIADGVDPLLIIKSAHKGMEEVGLLYEQGHYFLSGLVMAGEIMQQISQMVVPLTLGASFRRQVGSVVLGTVEGDIHFIGKDIFKAFLRGHGFTVQDLGVDVPREKFLAAVLEFKPDIVALSCLISTGLATLEATIAYLREHAAAAGKVPLYLAGGRKMSDKVGKMVGADMWTSDSMEGVRLCQKAMKRIAEDNP
ncbi:MAG: cobalamin-dependent protein [Pseudomonadota bacterium]